LRTPTAEYLPAYELGIAEVNKTGGVKGRQVQMIVEDSAATPQAGIATMRKLAQVDGVAAIVSQFTNVITAQIPLAEQLQMPVVGIVEAPNVVNNAAFVFAHGSRVSKTDELFSAYWKKHASSGFGRGSATTRPGRPSYRRCARMRRPPVPSSSRR